MVSLNEKSTFLMSGIAYTNSANNRTILIISSLFGVCPFFDRSRYTIPFKNTWYKAKINNPSIPTKIISF